MQRAAVCTAGAILSRLQPASGDVPAATASAFDLSRPGPNRIGRVFMKSDAKGQQAV